MSNKITEEGIRDIVRKALQERLVKKETEVIAEVIEEVKTEEVSDDQWYQGTLFESLKKRWAK